MCTKGQVAFWLYLKQFLLTEKIIDLYNIKEHTDDKIHCGLVIKYGNKGLH